MKPLDWPLLADENIHPEVVRGLIERGKDVRTVAQAGLCGKSDVEVLRCAVAEGRVVITHDGDFGKLAQLSGEPFIGIVYIRPGHIVAAFVLATLAAVEAAAVEETPPFLLVAERRGSTVRIRSRRPVG